MDLRGARALLFDKDGTLFDFHKSWGGLGAQAIAHFAEGDAALAARLAEVGGYDMDSGTYLPSSPIVSNSTWEIAELWAAVATDWSVEAIRDWLDDAAARISAAGLPPATPDLPGLLDRLIGAGCRLGVATNDSEAAARAQLAQVGVLDRFGFVAGYDSGWNPKPHPGMVIAFAAAMGVAAGEVVMIGDSLHDIRAAKAAGARAALGVLTGPAPGSWFRDEADLVLDSIGDLPAALGL